jgi:anti-sigma regulatory factor (Ser/Thr protein kinase)
LTDPELSVRLEPGLASIREARRFVGDVLEMWGIDGELVSIVSMLVCELVTNVLLHAEPPIDLALSSHDRRIRVEVGDGSDDKPMLIDASRPRLRGGYGLRLVERMADNWGSGPDPAGGKIVWFEIEHQDDRASGR